jgi:predicted dinucleotide-binding enzyme
VRIIDREPDKVARLAAGLQENTAAADVQAARATSIGGADIVVLALPYQAARQVAAQYAAALSGKTLIDISNPVDFSTFARTLIAGQAGGAPLDVFVGDDAAAKQAVTDLATSGGLRPIDADPLKRARELEAIRVPGGERAESRPWTATG